MRARIPVIALAVLSLPFLASDVRADFCPSPGPPCMCCQQPTEGDPVDVGGGNTLYRTTDVSLPTAFGPLSFTRMYTSQAHSNVFTIEVSNPNIAPPFPFGAGTDGLTHDGCTTGGRRLHQSMEPRMSKTNGWVDQFYCPATPGFCSLNNADSRALLERTATGFVYYDDGVGRLVYDKRWMDDAPYEVYFLSEVWGLDHRLATLTYAQPADPNCPVAPTGSATGLPYISKILSDDGSGFTLSYTPSSSRGRAECSLSSLSMHSPGTAGGDTAVVNYGLVSGYDFAHLTSATILGAGGGGSALLEQYTYSGSNQSAIQVVRGELSSLGIWTLPPFKQ